MAEILDGKKLAKSVRQKLSAEVADLTRKTGKAPRMVNVIIGDEHGSCSYAKSQKRGAEELGISYDLLSLRQGITEDELVDEIRALNADPDIHGIMIHKPVPAQIDYRRIANHVNTEKDLEGINVANIGKMVIGETRLIPCTPASVMEHLKSTGMSLRGKEAVIVGASEIVGKPLSLLLLNEMVTVSICHIATSQAGRLAEHVRRAEILIVAVGKAGLITGDMVREGAVVIDVGINNKDGQVVGDVVFEEVEKKASFITPVPGGVGPVTVAMLMRNAVEAYKMQKGLHHEKCLHSR